MAKRALIPREFGEQQTHTAKVRNTSENQTSTHKT
jgi:hypothetical protein